MSNQANLVKRSSPPDNNIYPQFFFVACGLGGIAFAPNAAIGITAFLVAMVAVLLLQIVWRLKQLLWVMGYGEAEATWLHERGLKKLPDWTDGPDQSKNKT